MLTSIDRAIQHDEEVYPDPFTFRPERFLKDGKLDPQVQDPEIAAFGLGRRICPGRYMVLDSVWITVVSILAMFNIEKAVDEDGKVIEPSGEYSSAAIRFVIQLLGIFNANHKCECLVQPSTTIQVQFSASLQRS
jgi:hypothetical protein